MCIRYNIAMMKTESPCIRNCCLDDNDICMGCFRTLDEIKNWLSMTNTQKISVLRSCKQRQQKRITPIRQAKE